MTDNIQSSDLEFPDAGSTHDPTLVVADASSLMFPDDDSQSHSSTPAKKAKAHATEHAPVPKPPVKTSASHSAQRSSQHSASESAESFSVPAVNAPIFQSVAEEQTFPESAPIAESTPVEADNHSAQEQTESEATTFFTPFDSIEDTDVPQQDTQYVPTSTLGSTTAFPVADASTVVDSLPLTTAQQPIVHEDDAETTMLIPPTPPFDRTRAVSSHEHSTVKVVPADDEDQNTTSEPSNNDDDDYFDDHARRNADETTAKKKRRKKIVIGAIAGVVVLALAGAGVAMWMSTRKSQQEQAALTECTNAQSAISASYKQLDTQISDAKTIAKTPASEVNDESALKNLNQTITAAEQLSAQSASLDSVCAAGLSAQALQQSTQELNSQSTSIEDSIAQLKTDAQAVTDAKNKQQQADLKKQLEDSIAEAQSTYDSSAGTVNDESVRDALKTAIDDATSVANGSSLTEQQVKDAQSALSAAISALEAEQAATTEAANAAAAEQYQQQLQQQQLQQQQQQVNPGVIDDGTGVTTDPNTVQNQVTPNTGTEVNPTTPDNTVTDQTNAGTVQ